MRIHTRTICLVLVLDMCPCVARSHEFCLYIKPDKKFLPRLMNATLNDELFFSIANHVLTVVDVDAFYVKPDVPRRELLHEGKVWWYTTR